MEKGGNLASILSEEDQKEIDKVTPYYTIYWVGGRKLNADEDSLRWTDGSPWGGYDNFQPYYKPYHDYRCLYISRGWWYIYHCPYRMGYVCKFPSSKPSLDLYQLSSYNLSQSIDFYVDITDESLGGSEVPGFKVDLPIHNIHFT